MAIESCVFDRDYEHEQEHEHGDLGLKLDFLATGQYTVLSTERVPSTLRPES